MIQETPFKIKDASPNNNNKKRNHTVIKIAYTYPFGRIVACVQCFYDRLSCGLPPLVKRRPRQWNSNERQHVFNCNSVQFNCFFLFSSPYTDICIFIYFHYKSLFEWMDVLQVAACNRDDEWILNSNKIGKTRNTFSWMSSSYVYWKQNIILHNTQHNNVI